MNWSDIGTYGVIGVILLIFAATGFFRGLIGTTLGILCLCIAAYCTYWVHQHAYELINPWFENPQPWLCWTAAIAAGLLVFIVCRFLFRFLIDPFNVSKTGQRIGFGFPAAVITCCIGIAFIWITLVGARYAGCVAELQHTSTATRAEQSEAGTVQITHERVLPWLITARQSLNQSSLGQWLLGTDPLHLEDRLNLSKLLVYYHHTRSRHIMLRKPEFLTIINQTAFLNLAHDPSIKEAALSDYPVSLLSSPKLTLALKDQTLQNQLRNWDPAHMNQLAAPGPSR